MYVAARAVVYLGIFAVAVRGSEDLIKVSEDAKKGDTKDPIDSDTGNWTVGDCILAQFAIDITLHPNATDKNETLTLAVLPRAKADESQNNCKNETQSLSLDWSEQEKNSTLQLARNFTIEFRNTNDTAYGVSRVYGNFELAHFQQEYEKENINVTSSVDIDFQWGPTVFRVPIGYSFLCLDVGTWRFNSNLHYSFPDAPTRGTPLENATVSAKNVRLDAFRLKTAPPSGYQVPMDCALQPNDIVPVAVGVTLAVMVVLVLCSYLFCRRGARLRGYQSV